MVARALASVSVHGWMFFRVFIFKDNQIHWPSLLRAKSVAVLWVIARYAPNYIQLDRIWGRSDSPDTQRKFHLTFLRGKKFSALARNLILCFAFQAAWTWQLRWGRLKISLCRFHLQIAFLFSSATHPLKFQPWSPCIAGRTWIIAEHLSFLFSNIFSYE